MSSLFVDTHNVVAILEKSDAAEGFDQIIDFLSGSYIHYALTVNPYIYISCIKQFWNTASVKRSCDVTRLQALVDKKKIVIFEIVIHEILQLNDAKGVVCLSNEEIFAGLAQMGYEKPAKRTSWNEFSTPMASAVICLSKGQKFNFSKYIFDSLVRNVDSSFKFYMYPRLIQLIIQIQVGDLSTYTTRFIFPALTQKVFANMRRVGKGFLGVETPLFEGMLAVRQPTAEEVAEAQVQVDTAVAAAVEEHVAEDVAHDDISSPPPHLQQVLNVCSALTKRVKNLENDNAAQRLVIIKLKARGRMIDDIDMDERIELVKDAEVVESEGRHAVQQAEKQEEIYNLDLDHSSKVLISAASVTIPAVKPTIHAAAPTAVAAYTRKRKGVIIRDSEEELSSKTPAETPKDEIDRDHDDFNKDIDWNAAMDHVNQKSSNPQYIKRYQGMKKRPQTESEARKNMMNYLKNTAGYKMDFFKGMSYAQTLFGVFRVSSRHKKLGFPCAASATIPAVSVTIPVFVPTVVAAYTRRREGVTIRDPEEELPLKTPAETPKDVAHVATPSPAPHGIPYPPQEPSSPPQQPHVTPPAPTQGEAFPTTFQQVFDTCSALLCRVEHLEHDNVAQRLEIVKLKVRVKKLEHFDKVKSSMFWRLRKEDDSKVQDVVEVVTTAKLITEVVTATASQGSAASATIPARYQGMKKRPQTESEARKNMMIYLQNTAGYKMDFFKGMTYAQICPIIQARFVENIRFLFKSREEMEAEDQEIIKSINETPTHKAAKRRKLSEEAQEAKDLRKRLEVVEDEDDDVFV
uniref:Xylulose kinase-1 n=1 Tax=Tanacetum cinerariifolium TaxID=118510 RepID=A0A699HVL1_TANCI|nr:hypothetical protein [Tanacetum cinerariifolium]